MLYLIGTGLTEEDISLRSLEILKRCKKIYLETYTAKLNLEKIQKCLNLKIEPAFRNFVEKSEIFIEEAKNDDIALLVVGTPFFATTHTEIIIQAKNNGVITKVIHNSSILNIYGSCGLYSYSFGRTVSIPFFEPNWKPTSFYNYILENKKINLHTLCLLDIRVDEETERFMTADIAINQLLEC